MLKIHIIDSSGHVNITQVSALSNDYLGGLVGALAANGSVINPLKLVRLLFLEQNSMVVYNLVYENHNFILLTIYTLFL